MSSVETGVAKKGRLRRVWKLTRLLRRPIYRRALRHRVAATVEHDRVAFDHDFASIIDVGAHHGQFALLAWSRFPHAELVCVEPLADAREKLATVLAAHPAATIIPVAAAQRPGVVDYHVSRLTDSSSLRSIKESYTSAFPGTEEAAVVRIEAAPLDDLLRERSLPRPCLLKLDVQGGELDVLLGAEELLRTVDEVFVECSFVEFYEGQALIDEVINHLHVRGLRLTGIYSVVRDGQGRCLQADLLFGRRDRR